VRTNSKNQSALSATKEDYIRVIFKLQDLHGGATVTEIADRLDLSKSTVSERLKNLVQDDLVVAEPYSSVQLTSAGYSVGEILTYKHRVIEVFLHSVLGMPVEDVHQEAHRLEHAVSDEVIKRMAKLVGDPEVDPHGSTIPKIKKWN
jgi:DtxR family Mn-dependent transcriptional regulator